MNAQIEDKKRKIRMVLWFFIVALVLSGATAIPVKTELNVILPFLSEKGELFALLNNVSVAIDRINEQYPFLFYGFDWLAFAHFVIAVAFFGPLKDPVKNIWVIEFGMIACMMVLPFALIAGGLRGLPLWWRLIDCSFGVVGIIPLWYCRNKILELEKLVATEKLNIVF